MQYQDIAEIICQKKSLRGISRKIVEDEVRKYAAKEKIDISTANDKDIKIIVHDIRASLRKMSGSYAGEDTAHDHVSANERREFYDVVRQKISSLSPRSILDLGCGINPLFLATKDITYYAYDIDESAVNKVNEFFRKNKIEGEAKAIDIREMNELPESDVCLLLKVLDVIDEKNHKNSELLINRINSRHVMISFSTKTLSGAPMRHPQRGWIERLLSRLGFKFDSFSIKNEIFYIAKRE